MVRPLDGNHLMGAFRARKITVCVVGCAIPLFVLVLFNIWRAQSKSNGYRSEIVGLLEASSPWLQALDWHISQCSETKETHGRTRKISVVGCIQSDDDLYLQTSCVSSNEIAPRIEIYVTTSMLREGIPFSGVIIRGSRPQRMSDHVSLSKPSGGCWRRDDVYARVKDGIVIVDSVVLPESLPHMKRYEESEQQLRMDSRLLAETALQKDHAFYSFLQKLAAAKFEQEENADKRAGILREQTDWLNDFATIEEKINEKLLLIKRYLELPLKDIYGNTSRLVALQDCQKALQLRRDLIRSDYSKLKAENQKNAKLHADFLAGRVIQIKPKAIGTFKTPDDDSGNPEITVPRNDGSRRKGWIRLEKQKRSGER